MRKLLILVSALMITSLCAFGQETPDNCFDEASGVFCITVEEPIDVTGPTGDLCLGEVCPGCTLDIPEEDCMLFVVEGGSNCFIHVIFNGQEQPDPNGQQYESEETQDVYLVGFWQYWCSNMSETWEEFEPGSEHWATNIWPLDEPNNDDDPNQVQFRLCGTIYVTCDAEPGEYTIELGLNSNYVCGSL